MLCDPGCLITFQTTMRSRPFSHDPGRFVRGQRRSLMAHFARSIRVANTILALAQNVRFVRILTVHLGRQN